MAVTIAWDETTGDFDLSSGGFRLLKGPQATRQNIIMAQRTVRGTWGGNIKTVGFPISGVVTAAMLLESSGDTQGLSVFIPVIRDFLRSQNGSVGVTGVAKVLTVPEVTIDEASRTIKYTVSVLDETSQILSLNGEIELTGGNQ